jgi:hypothetical protein
MKATQEENLAAFKSIVEYAKARGVRVAFMNYKAKVAELPDADLADYTAKAVAILLKEVPDLYMLGFRVGESGQKASFYEDAYLKGVADSGRTDLRLYTRSWLTSLKELERIAQVSNGRLDIEIKYNGEHLGLPYHAIHGGYHSYSYQDYVRAQAPYRIIWQVRANGTHRYWAWENTAFIRRTVRSWRFGDAKGFTLEPHVAYFDTQAASYYSNPDDQRVYRWIWQKHWMWYFAWGRIAYDPALPEATLVGEFRRRFGAAGPRIYQAVQQASAIVPLVYSYTAKGPDHRDIAPETETGIGKELLDFDRPGLDARSFARIGQYVEKRVSGQSDGRVSPLRVARLVGDAATSARAALESVGELTGEAGDQWRLLRTDLLCATHLGDYYANRVQGLVHLDYALKTASKVDYDKAVKLLAASRAGWKAMAQIGDAAYEPLVNKLRKQDNYRWMSKVDMLNKHDQGAGKLWSGAMPTEAGKPLEYLPTDLGQDPGITLTGVKHQITKEQVRISGQASSAMGVRRVVLWHKPLPSERKWESTPMTASDGSRFSARLKIGAEGLLYMIEVHTQDGLAKNFPDVMQVTPYWVVSPKDVAAARPAAPPAKQGPMF